MPSIRVDRVCPVFLCLIVLLLVICGPAGAAATARGVPTTTVAVIGSDLRVVTLDTLAPGITCPSGCECMERERAITAWGPNGFTQCAERACASDRSVTGALVVRYCLKKKTVTVPTTTLQVLVPVTLVTVTTTKTPLAPVTMLPLVLDSDGDGIPDSKDNCPDVANPDQKDSEPKQKDCSVLGPTPGSGTCYVRGPGDGIGDACDTCPLRFTSSQTDTDGDGVGDACDLCPAKFLDGCNKTEKTYCWDYKDAPGAEYEDMDGDNAGDRCDNCNAVYNPDQKDSDKDGYGDACDTCPFVANPEQEDVDRDGDGFADICDSCPSQFNPNQTPTVGSTGTGFAMATINSACYSCNMLANPATDDTNNNGINDSCEPYVSLLFVPLNWDKSQAQFDKAVAHQMKFFASSISLKDCPQRIKVTILDVKTQNNNGFICSRQNCGVDNVRTFVTGLGINVADYDAVVGVTSYPHCSDNSNIVGCSNLADTIWITSTYESVTAHEMGHIYGLADEYCSNPGGSTDCRCNDGDKASSACGVSGNDGAKTGDRNWLDPMLGCDPFGPTCVNADDQCKDVDYNICSLGNTNTGGGRCIMSYANAPEPREFCQHCKDWLATIPQLHCNSPPWPLNRTIMEMNLRITPADGVTEDKILLTDGRPTPDRQTSGGYTVRMLNADTSVSWERKFDLYFDYYGPRVLGADYSNVSYAYQSVSYRIPYNATNKKLEVYHGDKLIYTKDLIFCNSDGTCGSTETYQTCPKDCPLVKKDTVCTPLKDSTCDPDCRQGVDPDCGAALSLPLPLPLLAGISIVLVIAAGAGWYIMKKRKPQEK